MIYTSLERYKNFLQVPNEKSLKIGTLSTQDVLRIYLTFIKLYTDRKMLTEISASLASSLSRITKDKKKNKILFLKNKAKISLGHWKNSNKTSSCFQTRASHTDMLFF